MRKGLGALLAICLLSSIGLRSGVATAAETEIPSEGNEKEAREALRAMTLAGQAAEVRRVVLTRLASDRSAAEAEALLELVALAEAWSGVGCAEPIDSASAELPEDWGAALGVARAEVVRGAYAVATVHLELLRTSAPNLASAARALELREVARAALRARSSQDHVATDETSEDEPSSTETKWYGWQTLITDGASLLVTPIVPVGGAGGYLLGGPIVHIAHGRPATAAASLGVRIGAPLLGWFTGKALAAHECSSCSSRLVGGIYGVIGAGLGATAAVAIDAAVLGRKRAPIEQPRKTASVLPSAGPRREGGFDVGVVGTW